MIYGGGYLSLKTKRWIKNNFVRASFMFKRTAAYGIITRIQGWPSIRGALKF